MSCVDSKKKEITNIEKKDSLKYIVGFDHDAIGMFLDKQMFPHKMITIFNYRIRGKKYKRLPLSKNVLDTLILNNVIPKFSYGYHKPEIIDYESLLNLPSYEGDFYYEIINLDKFEKPKTIGRLYCFATYCKVFNFPRLFISDTTEKNGWFVFREIPFVKDDSFYSKEMLFLLNKHFGKFEITTLDKRAKWLEGSYEKISGKPYRIIKEEEVENKINR